MSVCCKLIFFVFNPAMIQAQFQSTQTKVPFFEKQLEDDGQTETQRNTQASPSHKDFVVHNMWSPQTYGTSTSWALVIVKSGVQFRLLLARTIF